MNKKSTQILLSILHLCLLGICVLTIYSGRNGASEAMVAHVSSETRIVGEPEPGTAAAPEAGSETDTEANADPEPEAEIPAPPDAGADREPATEEETETADSPSFSFHYTGTHSNLNIRSAPSLNDAIIGKIPPGRGGSVMELTNDEWALIDYQGTVGYCSRDYIELQETDK